MGRIIIVWGVRGLVDMKYLSKILLFILLATFSNPANAAWARIQGNSAAGTAATSTSVAFGSSVSVGDLVVVKVAYQSTATITVTDNAVGGPNIYTRAAFLTNTGSSMFITAVYYTVVQHGGAFTVACNFSISGFAPVSIEEYSFTPGTLSLATNSALGNSGSPLSGNVTFSASRALIVGAIGSSASATGTVTQLGNFNILTQTAWNVGVTFALYSVDYINATASPQNPGISFQNAVQWVDVSASFQSSGDVRGDAIWFGSTF